MSDPLPATTTTARPPNDADAPQSLPDWAIGLLIFIAALLIRLAYLFEIRSVPFVNYLVADAETYRNWAIQIVRGDWLGQEPFYQAPLYPYFLAVVMKFVGSDPLLLRGAQAAIGAAACVLLFQAGRLMFSRSAGAVAGVLFALYPPAIFYDALIQKAVLDGIGVAALLYLIARVQQRPSSKLFTALGACLGGLILTRENALLFIPIIAIWILVYFTRTSMQRRGQFAGCFALGLLLVLSPVAVRNYAVSRELILTTYQGGPNFYIGNNPNADGSYVPLRPGRGNTPHERIDATLIAEKAEGRKLTPREVSDYWFRRAFAFVREQPATWLRLLALKTFFAINTYEIPDAEDPNYYAQSSVILRYLSYFLHFGVILPLAAGAVQLLRRRREIWLPVILAAAVVAGVAAFYVFGRYRYPMAPILILLAAGGIVEALACIRARNAQSLWFAGLVAALAAIPANWPTPYPRDRQLAVSHTNAGIVLAQHGQLAQADRELRAALRIEPDFRDAHFGLGKVLLLQNRLPEALKSLDTALAAGPDVPYILATVGAADLMRSDWPTAELHLKGAVAGDPLDGEAWINLSEAYLRQSRWTEALQAAQSGARYSPRDAACLLRLALLQATLPDAALRDGVSAIRNAEEGLRLQRGADASALDALAAAYAEAGRFEDATRTIERAAQLARAATQLDLLGALEQRATLYRTRQPYRQAP